jgi:hypothetical protein
VAQLTLQQFNKGDQIFSDDSGSVVFEEEEDDFQNVFAKGKHTTKPSSSKPHKHYNEQHTKDTIPHHSLPKMQFPTFDGEHPKIWFDNCENYFTIYTIPDKLWVTTAAMHMQGNAAKRWQAYKQTHRNLTWKQFCSVVHEEFGSDDYRSAVNEMLSLKQTNTVEEYTTQLQALQFEVSMHSTNVDELFFATTYVNGLRDDIRAVVEPHTPTTVKKATTIAKIQQR